MTDYTKIGKEVGDLVTEKQRAYGDSFGKSGSIMRVLYPNGIPPEHMDNALTIVRIVDKLFRIATDKDAFGESPWRDVIGYAILAEARDRNAPEPGPERLTLEFAEPPGDGEKPTYPSDVVVEVRKNATTLPIDERLKTNMEKHFEWLRQQEEASHKKQKEAEHKKEPSPKADDYVPF